MPNPGFAVIPNWLLRSENVSPHAKMLYLHLSSRVDEHGVCWPSQRRLADESGMSERQVQRALSELKNFGIVRVEVEKHATGRRNRYHLIVDRFGGAATRA